MATSIPISSIVNVTPSVLAAGGGLNQLVGLIITSNVGAVADGAVQAFASSSAVATAFGGNSAEAAMAAAYFGGAVTAAERPSTLYFAGCATPASEINVSYLNSIAGQCTFQGFATAFELPAAALETIATWVGAQNDCYWFASWEPLANAGAFGTWLQGQEISGTTPFAGVDGTTAAAALGWMASTDFSQPNGRRTLAFVESPVITPSVTTLQQMQTLDAAGYSYYGSFANGSLAWFYPGSVSGSFMWADSYINQIWLNANLQSALVALFQAAGQIPFTAKGDSLIAAAFSDPINAALLFGAIQPGVTLSGVQQQLINSAAGNNSAAQTVQTRGWYLIPGASTASPAARASRGPITSVLYYADGGSVQSINVASVEVQ